MHCSQPKKLNVINLTNHDSITHVVAGWIKAFVSELARAVDPKLKDVEVGTIDRSNADFDHISRCVELAYAFPDKRARAAFLASAFFTPDYDALKWSAPELYKETANRGDMDNQIFDGLVVLVPESVELSAPYGEAFALTEENTYGTFCLVKNISQYVVWHEVAHMFGAFDHYNAAKAATPECASPKTCLMMWNATVSSGQMCERAIEEVREFI